MSSPHTTCVTAILLIILSIVGMYAFVPGTSALDLDSIAIPYWRIPQAVPEDNPHAPASGTRGIQNTSDCSLLFNFNMTHSIAATYFDSNLNVTQVFVADGSNNQVLRHDIDSALNMTTTPLSMTAGLPWAAADLDLDGNLDLVVQRGDGANGFLDIHSAPTWELRSRTVFPGMNVYFSASAANVDDDPYLEIHVLPTNLGLQGRVVIIQYDPEADTFVVTDDITPPRGTVGTSAIADFDGDGHVEIITGSDDEGHMLYEYDKGLTLIGPVGTYYWGMSRSGTVAWPKPGGVPHALIGHSRGEAGYLYQLLAPRVTTYSPYRTFSRRLLGSLAPIPVRPRMSIVMVWTN